MLCLTGMFSSSISNLASSGYIPSGGQPHYQQQPPVQQLQASYSGNGGFTTAFSGGAFSNPPGGNFAANTSSFSALSGNVSYANPSTTGFANQSSTYATNYSATPQTNAYARRSPAPGIGVSSRQMPHGGRGAGYGGAGSLGGRSGPNTNQSGSYRWATFKWPLLAKADCFERFKTTLSWRLLR